MLPIIVQKYGGSSLATPEHIQEVAKLIQKRIASGVRLCVVVSAMGKTTNQLLELAHKISKNPSRRELDMLLSCGERASMALLSMALHELSIPSMSLTGSQSGIITDNVHSGAQIIGVKPARVQEGLELGKVVIIAGFQGVSQNKEITTLGRGGSDTTAVAMAAALNAEACEIYSDVAGVYSADPRVIENAHHIDRISHDEMLELAASGAKVLNAEAVQYAKLKGIEITALKTGQSNPCTRIELAPRPTGTAPSCHLGLDPGSRNVMPTLDSRFRGNDNHTKVTAITAQEKLFCFKFESPQALTHLLTALKDLDVQPSQILGTQTGYCLISPENSHGLNKLSLLEGISQMTDCASISLIGNGLEADMETLLGTLDTLESLKIPLLGLLNSKLRIYLLITPSRVLEAVTALHKKNLEKYK